MLSSPETIVELSTGASLAGDSPLSCVRVEASPDLCGGVPSTEPVEVPMASPEGRTDPAKCLGDSGSPCNSGSPSRYPEDTAGPLPGTPLLTAPGRSAEAAHQSTPFGLNRFFLLGVYVLYTFVSARVLFGWPNLSSMLFRAGAFEWLCLGEDLVTDKRYICHAQDNAVQLLFTVGVAVAFCFSLGAGLLMDFKGPKVCACVGQLMNTTGWVLLGVASEQCQTYIPGVLCLALGADAGYLPCLNISNLFPRHEGLVIVTMSAAMSASFSIPTIMDTSWKNNPHQSFFSICMAYAGAGTGLCFVVALLLFPLRAYKSQEELSRLAGGVRASGAGLAMVDKHGIAAAGGGFDNSVQEEDCLVAPRSEANTRQSTGLRTEGQSGVGPAEEGAPSPVVVSLEVQEPSEQETPAVMIPFSKQLRSPYFYCFYIYWPLNALFYSFYMTSAENLFNASVNDLLGILGPVSMIPSIVLGKVADTWGVMSLVLFIISSGVFMYVFALTRVVPCYYISAVFSCLYVSNFSGQMYAYMGDTFKTTDFGKVVGLTSATGGLLSLLRIPLHDDLTVRIFKANYVYTCIIMLAISLICFCLALYLFFLKRKWPKAYLYPKERSRTSARVVHSP
ncbi:major facilitator family protein [Cystoisospora suis]|uniref:Major facilitator family protein n=1 Tax=Cystoisospora suis TaxID=483139 RepID=A0A2C6KEP5_9APIC|nr:major facilitator family protein [Cystoisospora suis]